MSTGADGIRFETDPLVFELQRQGGRQQREVVVHVPQSLAACGPVEVSVEPPTTPHRFRFDAGRARWHEAPEAPEEPHHIRVPVVCSGGTDGAEDEATLTLRLPSGESASVRLLAGVNRVLPLSEVLREEYRELRPDLAARLDAAAPPAGDAGDAGDAGHAGHAGHADIEAVEEDGERVGRLYDVLHADPDGLTALCFSGGGIRSATFNFGVLQGLASLGLLDRFHYLSTVSGGGYIGGWLSGWMHRAGPAEVAAQLTAPMPDPKCPEPAPIRHLRQYSNYLTPKLGVLSADTWTLAAIVLRNLMLNALVIVPILAALLTLPLLALARMPHSWLPRADGLFLAAFACGAVGLFFMNLLRANAAPRPGVPSPAWTRAFLPLGLLPLLAATALLVLAVDRYAPALDFTFGGVLLRSAAWAIGMPLVSYIASAALQKPLLGRKHASPFGDVVALLVTGGVVTLIYAAILSRWAPRLVREDLYLYPILGPALILLPLLLGKTLFMAFSSPAEEYSGGRTPEHADADREWWARWSAWILIVTVAWTLGSALVYFAPFLVGESRARIAAHMAAGGLGALTSLLGRGSKASKPGEQDSGWRRWVLALAAPLFCLVLLVVISAGTQDLLAGIFGQDTPARAGEAADRPMLAAAVAPPDPGATGAEPAVAGWLTTPADHPPFLGKAWQVLLAAAALLGLGTLMGYFVNVNRFSLQGMYRNRLVRSYLGASNRRRRPNLFTGFDLHDNLRMHALRSTNRPLHLVTMALNLVGGRDLAWQQRKAESFTATPLHCGAVGLGFRRSQVYGGQSGISLGTVVATSGAAASPNMGSHSSPAVTFIMTLFNARLGIWLGNPGKLGRYTTSRSGPRFSGRVIFEEALGMTDACHPYVNLSDGGHFENLGLYEMVRRRCRFIVVCDAGCDPTCSFEDLGNAIRKIRIDLGVPIDFEDRIRIFPKTCGGATVPADARYCAVGTIRYDQMDGPGAPAGTLLYVKPAICDTEPYDVTNYATSSPTFPHETTADQWFSESQFESYRALGKSALLRMAGGGPLPDLATFASRVKAYVDRATPGPPRVEVILPAALLPAGALQLSSPPAGGGGEAGTQAA